MDLKGDELTHKLIVIIITCSTICEVTSTFSTQSYQNMETIPELYLTSHDLKHLLSTGVGIGFPVLPAVSSPLCSVQLFCPKKVFVLHSASTLAPVAYKVCSLAPTFKHWYVP